MSVADDPPTVHSEVLPSEASRVGKHLYHSDDMVVVDTTRRGPGSSKRGAAKKARRTWGNHSFFGDLEDEDGSLWADSSRKASMSPGASSSHSKGCGVCAACSRCMGSTDKWCIDHNEACWRALKHCWFFVVLVGSFLWTSIARIALFIDIFITTGMYLRCPLEPRWSFQDASLDIFIQCLARCMLYFLLFAYRFRGLTKAWNSVMGITAVCLFYIAVKIGAAFNGKSSDEVKHLIIVQLCFILGEVALFQFLRKRPIK
eukprot:TRINITY_DN13231_c0_g1_i2.p1 TRINITY_DN13231_c0_g1~~TRINITY_DN13231_c0_g1_i2.p1  ORF type:complete len:259 (-),score=46.49 TRINITY_DN13231_c0_g1_i2:338-1114(-)